MTDLQTLKSRANLADIIAEHVPLTRRGKTLWGRCPFHDERTASFAVHAEYWYCHGCHATGDVIDFTARIQRVSKGRAIRLLAERYGVDLGAPVSRAQGAYMRSLRDQAEFWWAGRRAAALAALEAACDRFWADQTPRNEAWAAAAGAYLRMLDGVDPAIRGRCWLTLRTAEDAMAWREHQRERKMFEVIFDAALLSSVEREAFIAARGGEIGGILGNY